MRGTAMLGLVLHFREVVILKKTETRYAFKKRSRVCCHGRWC